MTLKERIEALCAIGGISGREEAVRSAIIEMIDGCCAWEIDALGNLLCRKTGRERPAKRLMLSAHMDEVGFIVTRIGEDGLLKFAAVGGIDPRVVVGKPVLVGDAMLPGVIGTKPVHLQESEERGKAPKLDSLYIDIGAESAEEAKEKVQLGWRGVFSDRVECFGDGYIKAKALDDRVGCAAMLKLLEEDLPVDTWFVFTVQEEVGCRGAVTAANRLDPCWAIVLEGTTAADFPGVEGGKEVCRLGEGIVIPFMDRGTVYDRRIFELATGLAEKNSIRCQTKQRIAGGTDASAIQRSNAGVKVITMAAPLRNIHSPASVGRLSDMEHLPVLCRLLLEEIAHGC